MSGIPPDVIASRKRKFEQRVPDGRPVAVTAELAAAVRSDAELAAKLQAEETLSSISWDSLASQEDVRRMQSEGPGPVYKVGEIVPISDRLHVIDQNYWNDPDKSTKRMLERDAQFPQLWMRPASGPWDPRRPCVDCTMEECKEIVEKITKKKVLGVDWASSAMFLCANPGNNKLLRFLVSWYKHVTSTFLYQLDDDRKVLRKQVICTSLQTFLGTDCQGIMRAVMNHEDYISSPDVLIQLNREKIIRALGSLPLFAITLRMGWERTAALKQYFAQKPLPGGWAMLPLEGEIPESQLRALLSRAHLP